MKQLVDSETLEHVLVDFLQPSLESKFLSFVEEVCFGLPKVHDLRTSVPILLLLHALLAVVRIHHARTCCCFTFNFTYIYINDFIFIKIVYSFVFVYL